MRSPWGPFWNDINCKWEGAGVCEPIPSGATAVVAPPKKKQYFLAKEKQFWKDYKKACMAEGGHPATVKSAAENGLVKAV